MASAIEIGITFRVKNVTYKFKAGPAVLRMPTMPAGGLEALDKAVQGLALLGLRDLEVEIFRQLLQGRRTVPELVDLIFHVDRPSQHFHAQYMRIWRAIREMEGKGLVSAPLLGRDNSYRLTEYGVNALATLALGRSPPKAIHRKAIILYASTFGVGLFAAIWPGRITVIAFFFLLGATANRLLTNFVEVC